ncbi:hypothetical protein [Piscirickettsia salmonis]|nr:hypothetical protein [Piscirickettsia salmonis]
MSFFFDKMTIKSIIENNIFSPILELLCMSIMYPGLHISLDTENTRFKGNPLYSLSGQSYFFCQEQGMEVDSHYISQQSSYEEIDWDKRYKFSFSEYRALTSTDKLQLTRLHAMRWNYGLLLLENYLPEMSPSNSRLLTEKQFVESPSENELLQKLYAGWFIYQVESQCAGISEATERLFKIEMDLAPNCELSKEKEIARKISLFRKSLNLLKARPENSNPRTIAAINKHELAILTSFIKYQLGQINQGDFEREIQTVEEQCAELLKDAPSKQFLKIAINILITCLTLGVANLVNKALTGEFLFFKNSEAKQLAVSVATSVGILHIQ